MTKHFCANYFGVMRIVTFCFKIVKRKILHNNNSNNSSNISSTNKSSFPFFNSTWIFFEMQISQSWLIIHCDWEHKAFKTFFLLKVRSLSFLQTATKQSIRSSITPSTPFLFKFLNFQHIFTLYRTFNTICNTFNPISHTFSKI